MGRPVSATGAGTDTEVTLTIPAVNANGRVRLHSWGGGFDVDPAATKLLTLESPSGTILQKWPIKAGGPAPFEGGPFEGAEGQAVVLRLAADTGGATGYLNANIDTD